MAITEKEFFSRVADKYGSYFDLSETVFNGTNSSLDIICPKHGKFTTSYASFMSPINKYGCMKCGKAHAANSKRISKDKFIERVGNKFGDVFTFENTVMTGMKKKTTITCKRHGDFDILPATLLLKRTVYGCPVCAKEGVANNLRMSFDEFNLRVAEKFGDRFSFKKEDYPENCDTKMKIICNLHGEFETTPYKLTKVSKHGCPKCAEVCVAKLKIKPLDQFINEVILKHGNKFDFSKTVYINTNTPVTIICKEHEEFQITPSTLLNSTHGCPVCTSEYKSKDRTQTQEEFEAKVYAKFGDKFDLSRVVYKNSRTSIIVGCKVHGWFETLPLYLIQSGKMYGCPACFRESTSSPEVEINQYLTSLGVNSEISNKRIITPYELDVVAEDNKLAIEYCGLYWHSDKLGRNKTSSFISKHKDKLNLTESKGYRLLTIFEDEWITKQDLVKSIIKRAVRQSNMQIVGARECKIIKLEKKKAQEFFDTYHIQGAKLSAYMYGLVYNDELLAAIAIGRKRMIYGYKGVSKYDVEIIRYATNDKYYVAGALAKLMKHFVSETGITDIISYIDRRWFTGEEYLKQGFEFVKYTDPGYYYVKGLERHHRAKFQKHKLPKLLEHFDPNLSEKKNMEMNGYSRIYDCGQMLVKWSK